MDKYTKTVISFLSELRPSMREDDDVVCMGVRNMSNVSCEVCKRPFEPYEYLVERPAEMFMPRRWHISCFKAAHGRKT